MPIAAAPSLDLSRLPAPAAIEPLDYETLLAERIADLRARWPEFDAIVESDPALKLQEVDAYREMMARARINDAVRSVMLAFATGGDLDNLAAFYGVERMLITPASFNQPAIYETDTELRRRVLLAPEAFGAAGPKGGWIYHALSADPRVVNADIWSSAPGRVDVAIQSREGDGTAADELLDIVRARLNRDDIRPLTDIVSVRSIENIPYAIHATAYILPGPAPELIRQEVTSALTVMTAERRTPSRDVPRSAVFAAASIGPVDKVILAQPVADIARGHGEVGLCTEISVEVVIYDG